MKKILVTIVGHDCPGIIHQVSKALAEAQIKILELTQTTLLGEFAGIFSCATPPELDLEKFKTTLAQAIEGNVLSHWVTEVVPGPPQAPVETAPYVLTLRGEDSLNLIAEFSGCMAGFDVNINDFRSLSRIKESFRLTMEQGQVIMFFELSVPKTVNQVAFRQALNLLAEEMGMELSLQHRDIFEAIHRL